MGNCHSYYITVVYIALLTPTITALYSSQPLGNVVCQSIREQVMEGTIQQKLSLSSEPDLIIGVAVLNQSVKTLTHKRLRQGILFLKWKRLG